MLFVERMNVSWCLFFFFFFSGIAYYIVFQNELCVAAVKRFELLPEIALLQKWFFIITKESADSNFGPCFWLALTHTLTRKLGVLPLGQSLLIHSVG